MLTKKQVSEIREHLDHANNPLFLFDNDPDGLCSFLILQRYVKKGKGFPIRSFPALSGDYFRKVQELNPDYVFVLDKPVVSKEFFDKVHEVNIPIVWIDHHGIDCDEIPDFVNYYNPRFNRKKSAEAVTALCYQVSRNVSLAWLAAAGCISDRFLPDFYKEVRETYPELTIDTQDPFDVFYNSELGKIARMLNFALKDKTSNVISMLRFLMKVNSPHEVLNDSPQNRLMHRRFEQIEFKYQRLIKKAVESVSAKKVLFFQYGGELSISSEISNFLSYKFPDKVVVVVYVTGVKANISVRGENVLDKVLRAIENLPGATGGGHKDATGAQLRIEDLKTFKGRFEEFVDG